jgi:two-component system, NarL family, sensor kinase
MEDQSQIAVAIALGCSAMFAMIIVIIVITAKYKRKFLKNQLNLRAIESVRHIEVFNAAIEAEERQKELIARNLHDTINPSLALVQQILHMHNKNRTDNNLQADSISDCEAMVEDCVRGIREACYNLVPHTLSYLGLFKAVEHLTFNVEKSKVAECKFELKNPNNISEVRFSTIQLNFFRIIQELLNNIVKHSGATKIRVAFIIEINHVLVKMTYDGSGIDSASIEHLRAKGLGLNSIESRLLLIKGTVKYSKGTLENQSVLTVPL